jgi:CBS domain-containing protein
MEMLVGDVMTKKVISIAADDSILKAAEIMLQNDISGLPVVDRDGNLVGIITERDFLPLAEMGTKRRRPRWLEFGIGPGRFAGNFVPGSSRKVREVMTVTPHTIAESGTLENAVDLMERYRIKRLPVIRDGKMVGIISRANLVRALVSLARSAPPSTRNDLAVQENIMSAFGTQPWAKGIHVIVNNGVAELWGTIIDENERVSCIDAAEKTAGVQQVRDHLVWVNPVSGMSFPSPEDAAEALF